MGWLLLVLALHTAALVILAQVPVQILGIEGQPVFLKAKVPPGFHVRDAIWRFLTPVEELVAISFEGTPQIQYLSRFYGRSRLHSNDTLEISPVALGDSGTFSALLVNTTGETEKHIFHLAVYDVVSTPTIRVFHEESDPNQSAGSCELFLACAAARGTNLTYSWARPWGKATAGGNHSTFENGQVLRTKLDLSEEMPATYTCTVANAVSTKSANITIREQCHRESEAKDAVYDCQNTVVIVATAVPLISFFLSLAAILIIYYRYRSGKHMSYTVAKNENFPA